MSIPWFPRQFCTHSTFADMQSFSQLIAAFSVGHSGLYDRSLASSLIKVPEATAMKINIFISNFLWISWDNTCSLKTFRAWRCKYQIWIYLFPFCQSGMSSASLSKYQCKSQIIKTNCFCFWKLKSVNFIAKMNIPMIEKVIHFIRFLGQFIFCCDNGQET